MTFPAMDQCQQYFDKFQNEKTFLEMFPDLSFVKYTTQKIIEEIASGQSRACLSYVSTQCFICAADSPQAPGLTAALTLASPAGSLHTFSLCCSLPQPSLELAQWISLLAKTTRSCKGSQSARAKEDWTSFQDQLLGYWDRNRNNLAWFLTVQLMGLVS